MAKRQVLESRFEISTVVVGDGREEEVQETKGFEQDPQDGPQGLAVRSRSTTWKAIDLQEAKSVQTPGEDEWSWQEEEDRERLNNQDVSQYRALAARANISPWTACTSSTWSKRHVGR